MRYNRSLTWFLVLLMLASVVSTQALFDRSSKPHEKELKQAILSLKDPLIPSVTALKVLSFGQQAAVADWLWLNAIQYFGSASPYGTYPALYPFLNTITDLDPKFSYAYEFGMVVLPFMNNPDGAIALGEKAQTNLPGNGLLSYYLASVYHLNRKDYEKAHFYYDKASKESGAPGAARLLAGVTLNNVRNTLADRLVTLEFWRTVYENAKSQEERERAEAWFNHIQLVYNLEFAAEQFKTKNGRFPASFAELKTAGLIAEVPTTSLNRELRLNPETGVVSFDTIAPEPAE